MNEPIIDPSTLTHEGKEWIAFQYSNGIEYENYTEIPEYVASAKQTLYLLRELFGHKNLENWLRRAYGNTDNKS